MIIAKPRPGRTLAASLLACLIGVLPWFTVPGTAAAQAPYSHPGAPPPSSRYAAPGDAARAYSAPEFIRDLVPAGYRLTIRLGPGQKPEDIRVVQRGQALIIASARERYASAERNHHDGHGYSRQFSFSTSRFQRRIGLPPDADARAMRRTDTKDAVVIVLPRR